MHLFIPIRTNPFSCGRPHLSMHPFAVPMMTVVVMTMTVVVALLVATVVATPTMGMLTAALAVENGSPGGLH